MRTKILLLELNTFTRDLVEVNKYVGERSRKGCWIVNVKILRNHERRKHIIFSQSFDEAIDSNLPLLTIGCKIVLSQIIGSENTKNVIACKLVVQINTDSFLSQASGVGISTRVLGCNNSNQSLCSRSKDMKDFKIRSQQDSCHAKWLAKDIMRRLGCACRK